MVIEITINSQQKRFSQPTNRSLGNKLSLRIIGRNHIHDYQLPGPISAGNLISGVNEPTDSIDAVRTHGDNKDQNIALIGDWQITETFNFSAQTYYRDRENYFGSIFSELDLIQLYDSGLDLSTNLSFRSLPLDWTQGISYKNPRYIRTNGGATSSTRQIIQGRIDSIAYFSAAKYSPIEQFAFGFGWRINRANNRFDKNKPEVDQRREIWKNEAFETDLLWQISAGTIGFFNAAKTFRIPNVDELALSPSSLKPQTSKRYEAGFKHETSFFDASLTLFQSETENEILFRAGDSAGSLASGENINAPKPIIRDGVETSFGLYFNSGLSMNYQFGYVEAKDDLGNRIPHVARYNHSLKASLSSGAWNFSANTRYTSSRLDGNDNDGDLAREGYKLDSYILTGIRIAFEKPVPIGRFHFFAGINNLANEQYITASYSQTVYPGNGREYFAGIKHEI